jgi:hypothetical protein
LKKKGGMPSVKKVILKGTTANTPPTGVKTIFNAFAPVATTSWRSDGCPV